MTSSRNDEFQDTLSQVNSGQQVERDSSRAKVPRTFSDEQPIEHSILQPMVSSAICLLNPNDPPPPWAEDPRQAHSIADQDRAM